ncbi:TIGR02530 family flagellar biosynthesis protein [Evansella tamaricis]|uniref:Flagellar protein n=1 Tax=Evansella tamaricis TaxID=2069301 RepID=A0ABS6JQH5_9BACI|nr:TIGR02530 family flagellar biosynthesis protein [Evansella tamaricis]MBU9714548.1 flagellar protein [Evansella tamaricis]
MSYKIMPHHLQHGPIKPAAPKVKPGNVTSSTFESVLQKTMESATGIKVSKHAEKRLQERGIHISSETWERIQEKVVEASRKGVNDSLVITHNAALVISAKNKTVITAMDREEAQAQLFTNINGAILMD